MDRASIPRSGTGLTDLFVTFLSIGLSGFGGVLPWAHRVLVERRGWLSDAEFTDLLSLCQFLPGPNIVNMSICIGVRAKGAAGAVAALCGLLLMPMVIVLLLAVLYDQFGNLAEVQRAFLGISAAAAGLVAAMAFKIMRPVRTVPRILAIAGLVFLGVAIARLPLVWVILALAPVSIAWTWMRSR